MHIKIINGLIEPPHIPFNLFLINATNETGVHDDDDV